MPNSLDDTDVAILNMLQDDCRIPHKHLASTLLTSITPIHRRIRRLVRDGFIRKYVAMIDPEKVDRALVAYTHIKLKDHSQIALTDFMDKIKQLNEVMECYHLSGDFDFLLRIAVKDMGGYSEFAIKSLSMLPNVGVVQTSFVLSEVKYKTAYFLK